MKASFGDRPGLLIDLHGQGNKPSRIEIGYGLSKEDLASKELDSFAERTTIRGLVERSGKSLSDLVFGSEGFGAGLNGEGLRTMPSPEDQIPIGKFFRGGFTVFRHGSRRGGIFDAIQFEFPTNVRTIARERKRASRKTAEVIQRFLETFYGSDEIEED